MKHPFFIFLFTLSISLTSAQSDISNKEHLDKIEKYGNTNIDSLFFYARKSQKSLDPCTKNLGIIGEATAYYKKGDFETSESICLKVLKSLATKSTSCDHKISLSALNRLFWIKKNQGKYTKAFYYLLEKKKVIETIPKKDLYYYLHKLSVNNNIASIKEIVGLPNEALRILKETTNELKNLNNDNAYYYNHLKVIHASNLNTIGNTYYNLGKDSISSYLDSAAVYYKKAFHVAQSFDPPHKNSRQLYTLKKVKILAQKKQYKKALVVLLSLENQVISNGVQQDINFLKSIVYNNLNKRDSTLYYATKFLSYSKNTPNAKKNTIAIFGILANQYHSEKKSDSAYKYSRLGIEALAQFTSNRNKINKTHYKYSFSQIKKENEAVLSSDHKTHTFQILFISITAVILILFLIYRSKLKRRKALHNFDVILDEIQLPTPSPKKDYKIEKNIEENILRQLEELKNSTDYLSSDFNIKLLADKLKTNTSYLSYILNNTKNQSFKQYITKLRIDYLTEKLNTDEQYLNYTIQYLAEEIGYTNASAFTRAFKKELGITPSEYIKSLK